MNEKPMTRRDVLALVVYAALVLVGSSAIFHFFEIVVLARLSFFRSTSIFPFGLWPLTAFNLLFPLALLPFVRLIAGAAAGRAAEKEALKTNQMSLLISIAGLLMFLFAVISTFSSTYILWNQFSTQGKMFNSNPGHYYSSVAMSLLRLSLGFALAFFPAIFDSLRHAMKSEERA